MNLWLTFRLSLSRIVAAKVRSGLTMLGIIIGVSAVVALTAVGQGAEQGIDSSLASLGANQITVSASTPTGLEEKDAAAIADIEGVLKTSTEVRTQGTIAYGSESIRASIIGVSPTYEVSETLTLPLDLSSRPLPVCRTLGRLSCLREVLISWGSRLIPLEVASGSTA